MSVPATGTGARPPHALAAVCLVLFLTFLDNTVVSVILGQVQQDLAVGVTGLQWVVNGYMLTFAALMLTCGTLADRFGRKKVMLTGVAVFCAGALIAMLADSLALLITGRVVMGVGAAASEPGTLSMLRHVYPERAARARALGAWAAVSGLALAFGPVIGGVLVSLSGWRAVFAFSLVLGIVALAGGWRVLPENANPTARRLDVPGLVTGSGALAAATFAVIEGETYGYRTWWIIALFAAAAVLAGLFVVVERRSEAPVLRPELFRTPTFVGANLVAFAMNFGTFAIFFFTALYLEIIAGFSGYGIAGAFAAMSGAMVLAAIFTGRAVARHGPREVMAAGCILAAAGILIAHHVLGPTVSTTTIAGPLAMAGVGFGMSLVSVNAAVLRVVPGEQSGVAASTVNTAREVGGVAGVSVLGAIVNARLTHDLLGRLKELGVPPTFQQVVIQGVTHGAMHGGGGGQQAAAASQGGHAAMVHAVIQAAFGAFGSGLRTSLLIAAALLLVGALLAALLVKPLPATSEREAPVDGRTARV